MVSARVNRDWFYKLASDLQDERVEAAVGLIGELSALTLPDDADEWSYVLKRLINGLASSRNSARLGFSLCLAEVVNVALNMEGDVPAELGSMNNLLDLLSDTLSLNSKSADSKKPAKGKDERGLLFGKMFGLQALLSEVVFAKIFISEDGEISAFAFRFMDELCQLAVVRTWLREPCLFTLFQAIQKLLPYVDIHVAQSILKLLDQYQLTLTNEGIAIYVLLNHNRSVDLSSALAQVTLSSKSWKANDPLARGNLPLLSKVLCNSGAADGEDSVKAANWAPRLHFVWDVLLPVVTQEPSSSNGSGKQKNKKRKKEKSHIIQFPEFWQAAVDETIFNEKASNERKFLGFVIFEKTLPLVPSNWVSCCFSQNFLRTLINHSSDSRRFLFKISHKILNSIVDICQKDPSHKLVPCFTALLFGPNGSINFDKLTKTKTVSKLLALDQLDEATLCEIFESLSNYSVKSSSSAEKTQLQFALDTLLYVVRGHRAQLTHDMVVELLLRPIVSLAFFFEGDETINTLANERLQSILSEAMQSTTQNHSYQYYALQMIREAESSGKQLATKMDESLNEVKENAFKVLSSVSTDLENAQLRGIEMLLSMSLLQLYSGESDAVQVAEELCSFYKNRDENDSSLVGMTEILLSLLAQRKALLKKSSLYVWQQFIEDIGEEELKVLLDVLSARENKKGFSQLFEGAGEYEAMDEGSSEEKELDDEKSEEEDEEDEQDESSIEDDDESSASVDDEQEEGAEQSDIAKIDREAASALAKALNLPENIVNEKGEVKFDQLGDDDEHEFDAEEDGDEDEESMDDEKMMELDGQLSEIFKRRKQALSSISTGNQRKIEAQESRESVIAFKQRIIDMLEIYVRHVEKSALKESNLEAEKSAYPPCLLLIQPMIRCIQQTTDKALANRIAKLLKSKLFKIKTSFFSRISHQNTLFEMLKSVHDALLQSKPGLHQETYYSVGSSASLFLSKIIMESSDGNSDDNLGQIIDLYAETMKKWASSGKFGPSLFMDLPNWLFTRKQTC
ncbi:hypothetical protein HG536_0H04730 [Torulaspora globosa]|uniref:DNA polymerase V n=1 Tax=Torulaspora globosa TaxID=48254 RepID=A0A7G3ZNL1_9SACH|nr:uncharacterized protein HG536_0H04730 [Torulaspora globosa]QLL35097.1 hypothetical protein HG536_0H04730 [Torulaspora globosa]